MAVPAAPTPAYGEDAGLPGVRRAWSAGLAGIGFAIVMAASVLTEGGRPDTFAADRQITAFFRGHADQVRGAVAAFLLIPAAFMFLWFLAGLYGRLRAADRDGGQLLGAGSFDGRRVRAAGRCVDPGPPGSDHPGVGRGERAITIATLAQLAASCALPFLLSALGRPDLTVPAIAVTIGILLLWLQAMLATPGHLTAGILLIAVPAALALTLSATTLTGGAITGFRALTTGALASPPPATP